MNPMNRMTCPQNTGALPPTQACPTQQTMPWSTLPQQAVTVPQAAQAAAINQTSPPANWLPETMIHPIYTPAFLLQNLGSLVRVEFLIGNSTTDRVGVLSEVGASYIVLNSLEGNSRIMCDLFAIKFVTIISQDATNILLNTYSSAEMAADASVLMAAAGR